MDGLTGIPNRRSFDDKAAEEFERCLRNQMDFGLILLDVDHFKFYNDHYGHAQGDDCLKSVASAIAGGAASNDGFAARYGGEEFVVLLPSASAVSCQSVAESLRSDIWALNIDHAASPVADRVTCSFGVAVAQPSSSISIEQIVERADEGLYECKANGRNCVSLKSF